MNQHHQASKSNINKAIGLFFAAIVLGVSYSVLQYTLYGYKVVIKNQLDSYRHVHGITSTNEISLERKSTKIFESLSLNEYKNTWIKKDIKSLANSIKDYIPSMTPNLKRLLKFAIEIKNIITLSIKIFFCKAVVIFMSLPLFVMTGCVGLVDGLSRREKRTAELGRESSYVFHRLSGFVIKGISILVIGWLVLPVSISPTGLFLCASIAFMLSVSFASSRFKKYL